MNAPPLIKPEVISLGCRLNIAESERMKAMLAEAGDVVVVNSCAVTAEAVRQTRQAISKARRARPDARLIVTGCAAETERAALGAMPEVDGLVANAAKLDPRSWNIALPEAPPPPKSRPSLVPVAGLACAGNVTALRKAKPHLTVIEGGAKKTEN